MGRRRLNKLLLREVCVVAIRDSLGGSSRDAPRPSRRDSVGTDYSKVTPDSRAERELRRDDATIRELRQQSAAIRESLGGLSMDGPSKSKSRIDDREHGHSRRESIAWAFDGTFLYGNRASNIVGSRSGVPECLPPNDGSKY